jgi:hypothetical protein
MTLRSQECYIPLNRLTINRNIRDTAQDPDLTWPQKGIVQQVIKHGGFIMKSRFYEAQRDGTVTTEFLALQQTQEDSTVTARSVTAESPALQQIQIQKDSTVTVRSPATQQIQLQQQPIKIDTTLVNDDRNVATAPNVTRILLDLIKMYSQTNSTKKYSEERYDHL